MKSKLLAIYPQFFCNETPCARHGSGGFMPIEIRLPSRDYDGPVGIAFVGGPVRRDDIQGGKPFSGRAGNLVRDMVTWMGDPQGGYAFLHAIRCGAAGRQGDEEEGSGVPEGEGDTSSWRNAYQLDYQHCRKHLEADLERLAPRVVCFLGLEAVKSFFPEADSHAKFANRVFDIDIGGKKVPAVSLLTPNILLENPHATSYFASGLNKAYDLAANGTDSIHHPSRWVTTPKIDYLDQPKMVGEMVDYLLEGTDPSQVCGFDVEAKNLNHRYGNQLTMLQFGVDPKHIFCVPFQYIHCPYSAEQVEEVRLHLVRLFTQKPKFRFWVTHFGQFEQARIMCSVLRGRTFSNAPMVDTAALAHLLDENRLRLNKYGIGFSLKLLTPETIGRNTYSEVAIQARSGGELYRLPPKDLLPYAADDVVNTLLLYEHYCMLAAQQGYLKPMIKLAANLYSRVFRSFATLQYNGLFCNLKQTRSLSSPNSVVIKRIREIEKELKSFPAVQAANKKITTDVLEGQRQIYGSMWAFNLSKKDHMLELFLNQMNLDPVEFTKTGEPSIDDTFYEEYKLQHPEVKLVSEWVGLKKMVTSYAKALGKYVDPSFNDVDHCTDSRIRADIGFINTVTGRPSAKNPNIQAVIRAEDLASQEIKSIYAAQQSYGAWAPGKPVERVFVQLDYMAAEVRAWGILAKDPGLGDAFRKGMAARQRYRTDPTPENKKIAEVEGDIHKQTASRMFKLDIYDVPKKKRQETKAIVFGLIAARGERAIADQLKMSDSQEKLDEVHRLCEEFRGMFPVSTGWLDRMEQEVFDKLEVESCIGRKRRVFAPLLNPWLSKAIKAAHGEAKRLARNNPIQGFMSDITVMGTSLMVEYIEEHQRDWKLVNVVHDSCLAEIPIDEVEEYIKIAEHIFTHGVMDEMTKIWGVEWWCPLEAEFDLGIRWGEMEKWDFSVKHLKYLIEWLRRGGFLEKDKKAA